MDWPQRKYILTLLFYHRMKENREILNRRKRISVIISKAKQRATGKTLQQITTKIVSNKVSEFQEVRSNSSWKKLHHTFKKRHLQKYPSVLQKDSRSACTNWRGATITSLLPSCLVQQNQRSQKSRSKCAMSSKMLNGCNLSQNQQRYLKKIIWNDVIE